jgi:hypothetical protein
MRASMLRRLTVSLSIILASVPRPVTAQDLAALRQEIATAGGRVVVGIKPATAAHGMVRPGVRALSRVEVQAVADRLAVSGLRVTRNYELVSAVAGVIPAEAVDRLLQDPNVEYVVPDRIHTLQDTAGPNPVPTPMTELVPWGVALINAASAWATTMPANYGEGVKVGILDTGGDPTHEDLVYAGGFDAVLGSALPADWNDNLAVCGGHGTHVAGTIAAQRGNGLGYVGVAPGASIYAIQIFSAYLDSRGILRCGAFTSDIIAGVEWAVTNGMQVVNMSYGGYGGDPAEHAAYQAAAAAGVHLVAAAGNNGLPTTGFTPAAYPEVIAVAATDQFDVRASFSNYGPEVLVSAPGVAVPSTLPGNTYGAYSGTSMASPHATGLVALLLAHDPTLSDLAIRGLLGAGAVDLGDPGRDDFYGEGRIDAFHSVSLESQQTTTATHLALLQQPGNGTSGQPLVPAPVVELRDAQDQPVHQAGVVVSVVVSSGPGRVSGLGTTPTRVGVAGASGRAPVEPASIAAVTDANGQAVFSNLIVTTVVTAPQQLTFSATGLTPVVSAPFTVTGSLITLTNGVPATGLTGATGSQRYFLLSLPAGLGTLAVSLTGGSGDADLVVKYGAPPTVASWDCVSATDGNEESCVIPNPAAGDWYILVLGYTSYAGVTLTATGSGTGATQMALLQQPTASTSGFPINPAPVIQLLDAQSQPIALADLPITAAVASGPGEVSRLAARSSKDAPAVQPQGAPVQPATATVLTDATGRAVFSSLIVTSLTTADLQLTFSGPNLTSRLSDPFTVTGTTPTRLANGVPVSGLSGATGSVSYYVLTVPAGQGTLTVNTQGLAGDVDVYLKLGTLPTTTSFYCASTSPTDQESCFIISPPAGEWYVLLQGYVSYTGVTLTATYQSPPTQLAITQQPGPATSGDSLFPAPVVQLLDAQGQPVPQPGVEVDAALSSGPGELSGMGAGPTASASSATGKRQPVAPAITTAFTDLSGKAVFSDLTITTLTTADHRLRFTSLGLTAAESNPFTVTARPVTVLANGVPVTAGGLVRSKAYYVITVPPGQFALTVTTGGGSGDVDLLVKHGALPTFGTFDCVSESYTTDEACQFSNPAPGDWYIMLYGFGNYSGVTLTATYALGAPLTVTLNGNGVGTVYGGSTLACRRAAGQTTGTCSVQVVDHADAVLYAQVDTGFNVQSGLGGWGGAASGCGSSPSCTVPINGPTSVSATFVTQFTLTVTGSGTGRGTVAGAGVNCSLNLGVASGTCSAVVSAGASISLAGTPTVGEKFNGWSGDCSGAGACQLSMTQPHSVLANFGDPPADLNRMVADLTGTPTLSPAEIQQWDCNSSAEFDVGDLLCYLDNTPGLTLTQQALTVIRSRTAGDPAKRPGATGRTGGAKAKE